MADPTDKTDTPSIVTPPLNTVTGSATVTDKRGKIKPKRSSKSERTHQRRLKQAAHKPGETGR